MFGSIVLGFARHESSTDAAGSGSKLRMRGLPSIRTTSRPASQRFSYFTAAFHQERVNNVKRAMLNAASTQPFQDRALCCLTLVAKRFVNVATFLSLCR